MHPKPQPLNTKHETLQPLHPEPSNRTKPWNPTLTTENLHFKDFWGPR